MGRWIWITYLLMVAIGVGATPLTWDQCVREADIANADLKAARKILQSAEFQRRGAYYNFFPQLSASFTLNYGTGSTSQIGSGGAIDRGGRASSQAITSITARQNVFSGLQDIAKTNQARANEEIARFSLQNVRALVSYNLKSAFASMAYAQKAILLANDITKRREVNERLVSLRYESGRENKGSLYLSEAYVKQAKYDEMLAKSALGVARAQLSHVLGRDEVEELTVVGSMPSSVPTSADADFQMLALETPAYRIAVAQEKSAEANITVSRALFFPTINLVGSMGNNIHDVEFSNRWLIGAEIFLPFFNGGRDFYAMKSAIENRRAARYTKESVVTQNMAKLRQAFMTYVNTIEKLDVDRGFVDAAMSRAKIAREKYNNGLISFEDWDLIENDLINRQKSFLESERDRIVAEAAWEQALGTGVIP